MSSKARFEGSLLFASIRYVFNNLGRPLVSPLKSSGSGSIRETNRSPKNSMNSFLVLNFGEGEDDSNDVIVFSTRFWVYQFIIILGGIYLFKP